MPLGLLFIVGALLGYWVPWVIWRAWKRDRD